MNNETGCVCAECGHEQPTMDPCAKCRSVRVVLIRVIRDLFGDDWRKSFDPEEAPIEGEGQVTVTKRAAKRHVDQPAEGEAVKNLEYCKRQYQLSMLRAQWWLTSAATGHYKQRKIYRGTLSHKGPEFTDDEKLADALATAQRHIELAAEFSERLAEVESESEEP